jgi:hypothetical protein
MRCEIDYSLVADDRTAHGVSVEKIEVDGVRALARELDAPSGCTGNGSDVVTCTTEERNEAAADNAGSAGDENLHDVLFFLSARGRIRAGNYGKYPRCTSATHNPYDQVRAKRTPIQLREQLFSTDGPRLRTHPK